jgi:DNA-binding NarL/FixJ family response regulator
MEQPSSSTYPLWNDISIILSPGPRIMTNTFLLVAAGEGSPWAETVREAVGPLGKLETATAADALALVAAEDYSMVIVDAGAADDPTSLVAALRRAAPSAPLVVVTASPTWQSAKEVFMAGASDYIRKSHDAPALAATLRDILAKSR